jgi:1-acyl-sn-glycerol-3-phosphate acyltransferase
MLLALTGVYWVFVVVTMPIWWLGAAAVWLVTVAFDRRRVTLHLYSCAWASFYVVMNPLWRARFTGRSRVPWGQPVVLVANHLSLLDILVVYGLFRPFKWVARADLFRVPVVGWNMRMNDYVPLVRGDRESIRRMMDHCRRHLARGASVLIFPEGTRSRDGRLQPFKEGAFRLAAEAGVPLIPIAISGTAEALPKAGLVLRDRMDARVEVLEPIPPSRDPEALRAAAHAAIAAALPERYRPAPAPVRH